MALEDDFRSAQERVKTLTTRPSNDTLLELYSLYKQGAEGDVQGKRPGFTNPVGRAKHDAWASVSGTTTDEAKQQYVELARGLTG